MSNYNFSEIEPKWQKYWLDNKLFSTPKSPQTKKKYILDMFPYPSGSGLHVGHPEGYTATDILSRYYRMKSYSVLHPMGWDAFGLPAENYAIKTGVHPQTSTIKNIETFTRQIKSLGLSYDWDREINTSDPNYYKWTQWLFLKLYENNLAYKKLAPVNWCENCHTVLANEQVIDGKCFRCNNSVVQKNMEQWFFKITDYADRLLNDLDNLDWPEPIKIMQKNWIGKSDGAVIKFSIVNLQFSIEVFTTRPDTLFGATYLVLAPDHQLISKLKNQISNLNEVEDYIKQTKSKTDLQRTDLNKEKSGVELKGVKAINPVNNKEIPIWIADYVLSGYGTGAIMAVPAHDQRDFEFASKYNIDIIRVIEGGELPYLGNGKLVNSDIFDGQLSNRINDEIIQHAKGKKTTQYKLRDWLISRQRYWGAPIPIIYCNKCGTMPVPERDLPVELPTDVDFKPTGESPLVNSISFHNVKCPKCNEPSRRESDTMDTFVDSSWYYLRYLDPRNDTSFASKDLIANWMPVDMYVGGAEHAVLHLLYARFITKFLHDINIVKFIEPFTTLKNQGLILAEDGRKMSKSLGNVINPDDIVSKYGADAFRLYEMFMGPLEDSKPWSTKNILGIKRFLDKVWRLSENINSTGKSFGNEVNSLIKVITSDIEKLSFNTAIARFMEFINTVSSSKLSLNTWKKYLILLSPFAPHICEELWEKTSETSSITQQKWPLYTEVKQTKINIPIQINNKVRDVIAVDRNITEDEIKKIVLGSDGCAPHLYNKKQKLFKYIPLKIVTIVVE